MARFSGWKQEKNSFSVLPICRNMGSSCHLFKFLRPFLMSLFIVLISPHQYAIRMANVLNLMVIKPVVDKTAFIHPNANFTRKCGDWKNVLYRAGRSHSGRLGMIMIEDGCNVQKNWYSPYVPGHNRYCWKKAHTLVMAQLYTVQHLVRTAHRHGIGIYGQYRNWWRECIVGALSFVPAEMIVGERKVVVGNPAEVIKDVSEEMIEWKTKGTALYQQLPVTDCHATLKPCWAFTSRMPAFRPAQRIFLKPGKTVSQIEENKQQTHYNLSINVNKPVYLTHSGILTFLTLTACTLTHLSERTKWSYPWHRA